MSALLAVWVQTFGDQPVRAVALLHTARTSGELSRALGNPLPSARSLGRLLAAREGCSIGDLQLARSVDRHDNCALWQVRSVSGRMLIPVNAYAAVRLPQQISLMDSMSTEAAT
ncbi:hypothetical protein [Aquabacterium humicola]|uniref:hypothetical protein n=1 Tax=Aquabacterium humicola TaxID=3237377 RepID=UPI002543FA4A|nr:hypothetical protein [Rubrivivax pictus]